MLIIELLARTALVVAFLIVLTRLNGLRSFSKMSSFDFALTVATGSLIAASILGPKPVTHGLVAIATVFGVQFAVAMMRSRTGTAEAAIDNVPLLLMEGETILDDNLRHARVTRDDLMGKLREANALNFADVRAVVLETTGDISVLHGGEVDPRLLEGVRRTP